MCIIESIIIEKVRYYLYTAPCIFSIIHERLQWMYLADFDNMEHQTFSIAT